MVLGNGTTLKIKENLGKSGSAKANFSLTNATIEMSGTNGKQLFQGFNDNDNITISGNNTINIINADNTWTQTGGNIKDGSSAGSITKAGAGTLIFASNNSYTGGTHVTGGTLQLGNGGTAGTAGTGVINLDANTNLKINRSDVYTLNNQITDAGNLIQAGTGTTIVNNATNNFSGTTSITGGVLQFDSKAAMGSATSDISTGTSNTLKGTLKLNFSESTDITRNIVGTGSFEKSNTGTVTLSGTTNTYSGKTTVSGGELVVDGSASINGTSDVLIDSGAAYTAAPNNQAKLTVQSGGTLATANNGDVEINNGAFTVNGTATVGNIKSTDTETGDKLATVTVANGGTLTTNLVAGDTLFQNFKTAPQQDTVVMNGTWNANVADGATVKQDSNAAITGTVTGAMNKTGTGTLVLTANNSGFAGTTAINAGTLQAGDGGTTGTFGAGNITIANGATAAVNRSDDYTLTQQITGAGTLKQDGAGKLTLNNAANSVGDTVVNNGTLEVAANLASTNVHINNGKLAVNDGVTLNSTTVDVGDGNGNANTAVLDNKGTVTATDINVKSDGKLDTTGTLTVDNALTVNGGKVNVNGGTTEAATTDIEDGAVAVENGAKLDSDTIKVGDGTGNAESASLTNKGTVDGNNITVAKDGKLDNQGTLGDANKPAITVDGGTLASSGTTNATSLTVNSGAVNVTDGKTSANTTTINSGAVTLTGGELAGGDITIGDKNGAAGSAKLNNQNGKVTAGNITVNGPDGQLDNAKELKATGELKADGGTINSSGTTTAKDIVVDNAGNLNVKGGTTTADTTNIKEGTVTVDNGAKLDGGDITVGDGNGSSAALNANGEVDAKNLTVNGPDGKVNVGNDTDAGSLTVKDGGKLDVNGGTVDINKGTATAPTTNIKEGTVTVDNGAKLDGGDITVGDGKDSTAALNANGEVEAKNLTVNGPDGKVAVGDDENKGSLKATESLTVNGGAVAIDNGQVETPKADINDGVVAVAKAAILAADALNVGDGSGAENTASLTSEGTVTAKDLNVKKDGNLAVNAGEVTAAESAKVDGGTVVIAKDGTLNAGENGDKDFAVNAGNVTVDGTLNARNITSNTAEDGSTDDAKINVGKGANLNLKPQNGDTLFAGLDTSKGDAINIDGALNINATGDVKQDEKAGITGSGDLNKNGEGNLTLTADNTIGKVNANDGGLTVDSGSKLNTKALNVGNGDDKDAIVNVNGDVKADDVNIAKDGTLNVNGDNGDVTAANPISMDGGNLNVNAKGTLSAPNITSPDTEDAKASKINVAKDGTLNLTPKDGDKLFDGFNSAPGGKDSINIDGTLNLDTASGTVTQPVNAPINGTGTFNKNGDGIFTVKADNPFSGNVNVNNGTLDIVEGGKLGQATVNVKPAATLSVDKNGTDLGNLKLDGQLHIIATPDGYSKINVAGEANIANGKLFTDIAGSNEKDLANGKFNDIIKASKIIGDQFASYDDNSKLFDFIPVVSGNSVNLVPFASTGNSLTEIVSQFGLGRALGAAQALDANFNRAPANELSRLFYTIRDEQQAANALLESLPTLAGASSQVLADSSKRLANLADIYERCENVNPQEDKHLWVKTFDSWGTQNHYQGAAGYRDNSYGFAAGVEKCHEQTRLGAMMGYAYDKVHSRQSVSNQSLRAETIQAGIYGNTPISSIADLDFRAGIGYSDVSTQRHIAFANRTAKGEYGNKLGYAGIGVNFNAYANEQVEVRPFVRMDYQVVRNNHYQERGAGVLNLKVDATTNQSLISQVGVDTRVRVADKLSVGARASVGYDLIGEPASTQAAFQGASDLKFITKGAQHGRVSGDVGLNVNYHITPAASLSVGYDASTRKGYIEHTPSVTFKMAF
ncbi:hypothetical protein QV08_06610 [Gallibacterium salpingitidis]|uniref:autotransporter domain-containing protein n=1 Tax=Gallibacterium salpingitidis TaxID=505341 RepID=UPI00080603A6|nr:autotransporter domain-containing protein [Gallibacterium salpingitidis]OBX07806.1 hypothetical protein QV08_06610 [Gallibacterium salpingitidis]